MKKIMAKRGSYVNKNGEKKTKWVKVGVINENSNGQYIILDPSINLSALDKSEGGDVFCSIYDNDYQDTTQQNSQQPDRFNVGGDINDKDYPF